MITKPFHALLMEIVCNSRLHFDLFSSHASLYKMKELDQMHASMYVVVSKTIIYSIYYTVQLHM